MSRRKRERDPRLPPEGAQPTALPLLEPAAPYATRAMVFSLVEIGGRTWTRWVGSVRLDGEQATDEERRAFGALVDSVRSTEAGHHVAAILSPPVQGDCVSLLVDGFMWTPGGRLAASGFVQHIASPQSAPDWLRREPDFKRVVAEDARRRVRERIVENMRESFGLLRPNGMRSAMHECPGALDDLLESGRVHRCSDGVSVWFELNDRPELEPTAPLTKRILEVIRGGAWIPRTYAGTIGTAASNPSLWLPTAGVGVEAIAAALGLGPGLDTVGVASALRRLAKDKSARVFIGADGARVRDVNPLRRAKP